MKKYFPLSIAAVASVAILSSCGTTQKLYMETFAPEEVALNLVKITDESNNSVIAGSIGYYNSYQDYAVTSQGVSKSNRLVWNTVSTLDISPDGSKIAYVTRMN